MTWLSLSSEHIAYDAPTPHKCHEDGVFAHCDGSESHYRKNPGKPGVVVILAPQKPEAGEALTVWGQSGQLSKSLSQNKKIKKAGDGSQYFQSSNISTKKSGDQFKGGRM